MATIKDRNGRNLVNTEEIKKRWKEYMEELYKRNFNELANYDGVVTHPELDILEYEVKWALGSTAANKASGCNGIPVELFKTLKDDGIRVLAFNMSANLEDPAVATEREKVNHFNSQEG